ncbi:hypothetical protein [Salegentibacter sp. F14]
MNRILLIAFLLNSILLSAQYNSEEVKEHQLKLNLLLTPNIDYEFGIAKHATFDIQLGTEVGGVEDLQTGDFYFGLFPSLNVSFRHYYNYERRINNAKNTLNNSANYYGLTTSFISGDPIIIAKDVEVFDDYFFRFGGIYGFQRTYLKSLILGAEFGLGYGYSESLDGRVIPILNFNLGWLII